MGTLRISFVFWCFLCFQITSTISESTKNVKFTDDAIVIEVAESHHRRKKDLLLAPEAIEHPYHPLYMLFLQRQGLWGNDLLASGPCFTSKGLLGHCISFRQCYPYFKLPVLNNSETWVLGMYDTCSYYTTQGRQMFGVCCTNSPSKPDQNPANMPAVEKEDEPVQSTTKNPNVPLSENHAIANWPPTHPPLPTHPPDHTIPPLPTHPPSPGYPIAQPVPVQTEAPPKPPTIPHPIWTPAPPKPPTYPGYPTHPTHTTAKPTKPTISPVDTSPPLADASCGAKHIYQDQERIVGGHNADVGEWPWIAALFNGGRQFCGGSLIDNIHILTAAHCVAHMSSWDVARLTVRLGDHNIKTNTETNHIEKKVQRVVRHRGFDSTTLYNDIAILTLNSPVQFTNQIKPVCLPSGAGQYTGQVATVIGWGSLRESGPQPSILQEVNIPIWSNQECRQKYGAAAPGGIVEHMLCAGQASRDSCSGDSGGPLMVNSGRWTQVGIVSWGIGCGKGQYPGVYTRVEKFLPWISKNLKQ